MSTEFEPTTERWQLGVGEDNPPNGIRVVDCQDVTIATIWKQPYDSERWAVSNAQLFVASKDLLDALKVACRWMGSHPGVVHGLVLAREGRTKQWAD